jgi:hypothetical protein
MFLISISALLMVIGLAETQKPPVLAQTSLSSKALPAKEFPKSTVKELTGKRCNLSFHYLS